MSDILNEITDGLNELIKETNEKYDKFLFEGNNDDSLKTFFSLIKYNGGEFKSDKQKNYLRRNGDYYYLTKSYSFGDHNGASTETAYEVFLDDIGVVKIIKWSKNKTKQQVYWQRTADSMRKSQESKINSDFAKILSDDIRARELEHQKVLDSIVQKVQEAQVNNGGTATFNKDSLENQFNQFTIRDRETFETNVDLAKFNNQYNQIKQYVKYNPVIGYLLVLFDELNEYFKLYPQGFQRWNPKFYDVNNPSDYKPEFQSIDAKKAYLDSLQSQQPIQKEEQSLNEKVYKVYHGTNQQFGKFDFKRATQGIVWFTDSPESIEKGEHGGAGNKIIMTRYITINNPAGWEEYKKYGLEQLRDRGYDGVILPQGDKTNYFVFSNKSISAKGLKELNEVGEANLTPYQYSINNNRSDYIICRFMTEDNDMYKVILAVVDADEKKGDTWEISFRVEGINSNIATVNKGRIYKVMATLGKILNDFVKEKSPFRIVIEPITSRDKEENKRRKVYELFISKNIPFGYRMKYDNEFIILEKTNSPKELNEVGEANAEAYPFTKERHKHEYLYRFTTEDQDNYVVNVMEMTSSWIVDYRLEKEDSQFVDVVNKGRIYRVMATLVEIMKDFVKLEHPNRIRFEPVKNNNEDERRAKLYSAYIKRNIPFNYNVKYDELGGFILTKKQSLGKN